MNRETEQHFRELPEVHIPRSKFIKPHKLNTTYSVGSIIPLYVDPDILPGTTVNMHMSSVVRLSTPLFPTFDNLFMDYMWFFVPYRLVWQHWVNFWGENPNAWYPQIEYEIPQIKAGTNGFQAKSIADYMGLPTGIPGIEVNALPVRAYVKIFNDWFRSTPLQQEAANSVGDGTASPANTNDDPMVYAYRGGTLPLKANKYFDYFTGCLPSAQRGPEVTLPLGTWAPVYTRDEETDPTTLGQTLRSVTWMSTNSQFTPVAGTRYPLVAGTTNDGTLNTGIQTGNTNSTLAGVTPINLWADLSNASSASITTLRQSIAIQHFYEAAARYGTGRYTEFLRGIFGVNSPDARLQRSEYLGGKRVPLNIQTVVQTSSTDATSPQGNTGAYSHTADTDEYFTKSFTEHGVLMCLGICRYHHSYDQGIPRGWSRKKWHQFYLPQFQGLSDQAVLNKEIVTTGTSTDDQVFGYQEYGAEYRYFPDMNTGEMRTTYAQTLDAWHYGDHYTAVPTLGSSWIQEDKTNVDRTLVVSSGLSDQIIGNFYFNPTYVMPMPIYNIPGLDTI